MAHISIIVPIYNASKTLRECLDSIIKQAYADWECFLVNDGSLDESQTIIDSYCNLDNRFVCLTKVNEGSPAKARQFAMSHIKSPFVVAIDADDLISEDYFDKLVARQEETSADVIVPILRYFDGQIYNVQWEKPDSSFDKKQVIRGKDACLLTIPEWIIGFSGSLVRRALMLSTSSGERMNSDELKTREILLRSESVAFSDAVYYYRFNPESVTKAISPNIFDKTINEGRLVDFAKKYFPENTELIETLRRKHFSGLQYNIVLFDQIKGKFSKIEGQAIERVLAESYRSIDIWSLFKSSFKWGLAVALLRRFKCFQRLVLSHFK